MLIFISLVQYHPTLRSYLNESICCSWRCGSKHCMSAVFSILDTLQHISYFYVCILKSDAVIFFKLVQSVTRTVFR